MSDLILLAAGFEMNFKTSPYHFFPIQLKLLKGLADSTAYNDENTSINLLRITSCTAFIETILFESLIAVISAKRNQQTDVILKRILEQKEAVISAATFRDFERLSEECLGKKLSSYTTTEIWEAIKILFALRNQIAHGKMLNIKFKVEGETFRGRPEKNYADIIEFLKKKKFLDDNDINFSSIFANRPVDFFISNTKFFFLDVTKNISEEFSTPTYDGFDHMRNSLSFVQ